MWAWVGTVMIAQVLAGDREVARQHQDLRAPNDRGALPKEENPRWGSMNSQGVQFVEMPIVSAGTLAVIGGISGSFYRAVTKLHPHQAMPSRSCGEQDAAELRRFRRQSQERHEVETEYMLMQRQQLLSRANLQGVPTSTVNRPYLTKVLVSGDSEGGASRRGCAL